MNEWKPYLNDRLIKECDGFYVIKEKDPSTSPPLFCPFCETIITSYYDEESFRKFECCDSCSNKIIYPKLEDWKVGWRPSKEYIKSKLEM